MVRIPIPVPAMSIDAPDTMYDRRKFMAYFGGLGLSTTLLPGVLWAQRSALARRRGSSIPRFRSGSIAARFMGFPGERKTCSP